jgi:hypothetical protein
LAVTFPAPAELVAGPAATVFAVAVVVLFCVASPVAGTALPWLEAEAAVVVEELGVAGTVDGCEVTMPPLIAGAPAVVADPVAAVIVGAPGVALAPCATVTLRGLAEAVAG